MAQSREAWLYVNLWNRGETGISFGPFKNVHADEEGIIVGTRPGCPQIPTTNVAVIDHTKDGAIRWKPFGGEGSYAYMTVKVVWEYE